MSIAWQQRVAIVVACHLCWASFASKSIIYYCDNESVVHIVNSKRSRIPRIMDLMRHLKTLLTLEHKFYLKIMHIEWKKNEIPDGLSRFQMERFWSLASPVQYHPYSWRSECRHQLLPGPFDCSINQRDLFLGQKEF